MATMTVRTHPAMIVDDNDSSILAMGSSPPVAVVEFIWHRCNNVYNVE